MSAASHLLQMRGLKLRRRACIIRRLESHLLQMRGLKREYRYDQNPGPFVASFTDAWIETLMYANWQSDAYVASFTDAWIETDWLPSPGGLAKVASFTDAWIETRQHVSCAYIIKSHLLQMRGLKQVAVTSMNRCRGRIFYRCVD